MYYYSFSNSTVKEHRTIFTKDIFNIVKEC